MLSVSKEHTGGWGEKWDFKCGLKEEFKVYIAFSLMTALQRESWGVGRWWNLIHVTAIQSSLRNHDPSPKGSRQARGGGEQPPPSRGSSRPGLPRPPWLRASPRREDSLGFQASGRPAGQGQEGKERGRGGHLGQPPGQEVLPLVLGRSAPTASLQREFCSLATWAWVHAQTTTKRTSAE